MRSSRILNLIVGLCALPMFIPSIRVDAADASATLIAAYLEFQNSSEIADSAIQFTPPWGDGRNRRTGLMINSDPSYEDEGSVWEFEYRRSDAGVQIIHPYNNGQCVITLHRDTIGISAPQRWVEIGYEPGNIVPINDSRPVRDVFPLEDNRSYQVRSVLNPDGAYTLYIDEVPVAFRAVGNTSPIDFTIDPATIFPGGSSWAKDPFVGDGFPTQWKKGFTGIILEPVDNAINQVSRLTYSPGIAAAPVIVIQPEGRTIFRGASVTFSVEVSSLSPLNYQWRIDGSNLPNETGASLTLSNVQPSQSGDYSVVVTDVAGVSTISDPARLTVNLPPPPAIAEQPQDARSESGGSARFEVAVEGIAPIEFQWFFNHEPIAGQTGSALELSNLTVEQSGEYRVEVSNQSEVTVLSELAALIVEPPRAPTLESQPGDVVAPPGEAVQWTVEAVGSVPLHYQWLHESRPLDGERGNALAFENASVDLNGYYQVRVDNEYGSTHSRRALLIVDDPAAPPANDLFLNRRILSGRRSRSANTNRNATKEDGEPEHSPTAGGKSIWWTWTAPADGRATLDTAGSEVDTVLSVYEGGELQSLNLVAANDDVPEGGTHSRVEFQAVAGAEYQIAVDAFAGQTGFIELELIAALERPALRLERSNNGLTLLWPGRFPEFHLETADRIDAANWTPVKAGVTIVNENNSLNVPPEERSRYFRLRED